MQQNEEIIMGKLQIINENSPANNTYTGDEPLYGIDESFEILTPWDLAVYIGGKLIIPTEDEVERYKAGQREWNQYICERNELIVQARIQKPQKQ